MSRRILLGCTVVTLMLTLPGALSAEEKKEKKRTKLPNIVWITSEDHGPHMGCYGDTFARTPNIDKLAKKGMMFTRCWSNAPVCAPARTTIISGLYPTSTGSEHMRSLTRLPNGFHMFPHYLRVLGYYCTNKIKEDYNLEKDAKVWDDSSKKAHWKNRKEGQPFFAVFNSLKSHESQIRNLKVKLVGDPSKVRIPAYHPDSPQVREDWTRYYDTIALADADAGEILRELEEAGLLEDTIIFYFADHGSGMPRSKRTPLNSGLHVPLVVYFPDNWKHLAPTGYQRGGRSDRLVSFIDLAPTALSIAGALPPSWMQGHAFAGKHIAKAPEFLHGFRGRMDERYDLQRSVTDGRYVYLRNYMPHLPAGQHVDYMFQTKTTQVWKQLFDEGKLNAAQSAFWRSRPAEELYDLQNDPDEVMNLIFLPSTGKTPDALKRFREAQLEHALKVRDVGLLPEDEIHRRSAFRTPYELGHDAKNYPLERILATAELASSLTSEGAGKLADTLKDDDSAVRYWSALGLLIHGGGAVTRHAATLRELLKDESPSVRVVAAEALGQFGTKDDVDASLKVLLELGHPKKNSIYVSLAALNALDRLGEKTRPVLATLRDWPAEGTPADHRAVPGIARLLTKIKKELKP
jgi:arylsulfatase A-like enzyme